MERTTVAVSKDVHEKLKRATSKVYVDTEIPVTLQDVVTAVLDQWADQVLSGRWATDMTDPVKAILEE